MGIEILGQRARQAARSSSVRSGGDARSAVPARASNCCRNSRLEMLRDRAAATSSSSATAAEARGTSTTQPSGGGAWARPSQRSWNVRKSLTDASLKALRKKLSRNATSISSSCRRFTRRAASSATLSSVDSAVGGGSAAAPPGAGSRASNRPSRLKVCMRACTPRVATTTWKRRAALGAEASRHTASMRGGEVLFKASAPAKCPMGSAGLFLITSLRASVMA
mmetsp:Transcript_59735/g.187409  ORF Transcript_59735/g.187409 Transcript_59735/m.187409 type:complete len:223 (-) Transcript_59735:197-865(-)